MAQPNPATRTYAKRMTVAMIGYAVLLVTAILAGNANPTAWWRYVLFVLPAVPGVFVVRAVTRFMGDVDELQRRIQLEALAFGFGAGSLITFTYGLLQVTGLPDLSWLWVWPVYAACWLVGGVFATRRYR
jgi:hypothetical protein